MYKKCSSRIYLLILQRLWGCPRSVSGQRFVFLYIHPDLVSLITAPICSAATMAIHVAEQRLLTPFPLWGDSFK